MIFNRKCFAALLLLFVSFNPVIALPGAQDNKSPASDDPKKMPTGLSDILLQTDIAEKISSDLDVQSHLNTAATSKGLRDMSYRGFSREDRIKGQEKCQKHWKFIYSVLTGNEAAESAVEVHLGGEQGTNSAQFFKCISFLNSVCDKRKGLRERPLRIDLTMSKYMTLTSEDAENTIEVPSKSPGCFFSLKIRRDRGAKASPASIVQFIQLANMKLSELDVSANHLGGDGTAALVEGLSEQADLKVLKLRSNSIKQNVAKLAAVFRSDKFKPKLLELDMTANYMGVEGTPAFVRSLAKQASLKVLNLAANHFSHEGATQMAAVFNSDDFAPKLSELDLSHNWMDDEDSVEILESLAQQEDLKVLKLNGNKIGQDGAPKISTIINSKEFTPKLSELHLYGNGIQSASLKDKSTRVML